VRAQLVSDWWSAGETTSAVMLAYRRDDVADLNSRARERMVEAGAVAGSELVVGRRQVAAGDRVLLRRNDRRLDIANGDRAVVIAADVDRRLVVRVRDRDVVLARDYLDAGPRASVQHGYAMTGHAAQGLTVDRAFVLATEETSREWLYMALSRGRLDNRLYGSAASLRERDEIAPAEPPRDARDVVKLAVERAAHGDRPTRAEPGARALIERLLIPSDVAERCQVSTKTVLRAVHRGRLRASRLGEQARSGSARPTWSAGSSRPCSTSRCRRPRWRCPCGGRQLRRLVGSCSHPRWAGRKKGSVSAVRRYER
jgi:hypothetical protein